MIHSVPDYTCASEAAEPAFTENANTGGSFLTRTNSNMATTLPSIVYTSLYVSGFIVSLPLLILLLLLAYKLLHNVISGSSSAVWSLPSPPRYPVLGHLGKFSPGKIHEYAEEWTRKIGHGKNIGIWLAHEATVFVNDVEDLQFILGKGQHHFTKAEAYHDMLDWTLPHSMLITDGEEWKAQRSTFNPSFHYGVIKNTQDHVYEETQILCEVTDEAITAGKDVNIALQFECLTLDVLGKTGFGVDFNAQRDPQYREAMRNMLNHSWDRMLDPLWRFRLGATRQSYKYKAMMEHLIKGVWEKRVKEGVDDEDTDLLAQMMRAEQKGADWITKYTNGDKWIQYRDQATLFLFAGSDTTSSLLASTVYLLARHPEKLKKLQDELDEHIDPIKQPGADECMHLPYLNAVIKEALRIRPSVAMVGRRCFEKITLPSGVTVTPTTNLICGILNLHLNPNVWGDDATEFKPERWINDKGELETKWPHANKDIPISNAYIPFASGQRTCIGQNLARIEAAISLAIVLRRYEFSIPKGKENYEPPFEISITMGYTAGLYMTAKRRVPRWKLNERIYYGKGLQTVEEQYPQAQPDPKPRTSMLRDD